MGRLENALRALDVELPTSSRPRLREAAWLDASSGGSASLPDGEHHAKLVALGVDRLLNWGAYFTREELFPPPDFTWKSKDGGPRGIDLRHVWWKAVRNLPDDRIAVLNRDGKLEVNYGRVTDAFFDLAKTELGVDLRALDGERIQDEISVRIRQAARLLARAAASARMDKVEWTSEELSAFALFEDKPGPGRPKVTVRDRACKAVDAAWKVMKALYGHRRDLAGMDPEFSKRLDGMALSDAALGCKRPDVSEERKPDNDTRKVKALVADLHAKLKALVPFGDAIKDVDGAEELAKKLPVYLGWVEDAMRTMRIKVDDDLGEAQASEDVGEAAPEDVYDAALRQFMRTTGAWEKALSRLAGGGKWRFVLPALKSNDGLRAKFAGPKPKGGIAIDAPAFVVSIRYDRARDLYDLVLEWWPSMLAQGPAESKKLDGMDWESFERPEQLMAGMFKKS